MSTYQGSHRAERRAGRGRARTAEPERPEDGFYAWLAPFAPYEPYAPYEPWAEPPQAPYADGGTGTAGSPGTPGSARPQAAPHSRPQPPRQAGTVSPEPAAPGAAASGSAEQTAGTAWRGRTAARAFRDGDTVQEAPGAHPPAAGDFAAPDPPQDRPADTGPGRAPGPSAPPSGRRPHRHAAPGGTSGPAGGGAGSTGSPGAAVRGRRGSSPVAAFGPAPQLPARPGRPVTEAPGAYTHPPYDPSSARTEPQVPRPRQYPSAAVPDTLAETLPGAPLAPSGGRAAARHAARRKRASARPEQLRRLLPRALVLVFLAGGTTAFVADDKEVRLSVDGEPRTFHTFADDVEELLAEEGVRLGPHDTVEPVPGGSLTDGDEITVRHGRPLSLTLDGEHRRVWVTAGTVEGALEELGIRSEGAYLSLPRRTSLPRAGRALEVRTERTVTFLADGRERTLRTNAATVAEATEAAGIVLRGLDTTSAPPDSFPRDGMTVTVMRITGREETREEPVPFRTVKRPDPALFRGTEVTDRYGVRGVKRVTYSVRTVNGARQRPEAVRTETMREPVEQIIRYGTRPLPERVPGAEGLNWSAMADCESGGRPGAVSPDGTHGGLYQLTTPTWHRLGGTGRPQHASAAEQTYRAKKLYVQQGADPWPGCGRKLHE